MNRYVAWEQPGSPAPSWATHPVSAADFQALASVTRRTGWKVLLTMNLAHYNPVAVEQEAAAASKELQGALAGIAIGNEPNSFERFGLRSAGWDFSEYANQLAGYRGAVAAGAPGAHIAAPDASTGEEPLPWVWESIGLHPTILTDHYYPLTRCGHKPTITQMLSPEVRLEETVMLSTLGDIQRTARTPLELDETNDVSCKGEPGVSNAFASALWAADYIARAMRSGLRGVDFHDLPELPLSYSPLVGEGSALHANPEWYALLLTHALQGTSVLPTAVGSGTDLTAQGFLGADGSVELLLVNFAPVGTRPLPVALQTPRPRLRAGNHPAPHGPVRGGHRGRGARRRGSVGLRELEAEAAAAERERAQRRDVAVDARRQRGAGHDPAAVARPRRARGPRGRSRAGRKSPGGAADGPPMWRAARRASRTPDAHAAGRAAEC